MEDKTRTVLVMFQILCLIHRLQGERLLCRTQCPTDDAGAKPVCGSDGRTYSSRCLLQLARCTGNFKVKMAHKGKCRGTQKFPLQGDNLVISPTSKCLRDRQQALHNALSKDLIMLGVFIPKCESDGSYSQVQCLNTSRYCWCVDSMGKEIHGTRVRISRPRCPTLAHTKPSAKPVPKVNWRTVKPCTNCKGCSQEVRTGFNERLVTFLSNEFMKYVKRSSPSSAEKVQGQGASMEKAHLLSWKFTHLDTNADYVLDVRELHGFLKTTKKSIHPKKCSRTFVAYCDKDRDHKLSLNEWHICFGVKEKKKCTGDYLAALKSSRQSSGFNQRYLPRCASDGSYAPTQCSYTIGYCWCVDVDTGRPIPNTTTKSNSLDCWKYITQDNSTSIVKKECAQDLWTSFKKHMIKLFRKDVEQDSPSTTENESTGSSMRNQRRSARSGDLRLLGTYLTDHQVLIWKFNRLDKNKDKLLVSSEFLTPPMKKYLGNIKRGRKCGKKLLNECDLDKDRGLSMMEWTHCLRTSRRMPLQ